MGDAMSARDQGRAAALPDAVAAGRGSRRSRLEWLLFPVAEPITSRGAPRVILLVGLTVGGALLALLRMPFDHWNLLWAEDGAVFLRDALRGEPGAIVEPYNGYMHFVPRVAMLIAARAPIEIVPTVVTIMAAVITSLLATAVFVFVETRIASIPLRFAAWLIVVVSPSAGGEVANNFANLHWIFIIAAMCAMWVRARSISFVIMQSVVIWCAVTSDPLALFILPLAAVRWWLLREARDRVVVYTLLAAMAVQAAVVIANILAGTGRLLSTTLPSLAELVEYYLFRVVMPSVFGVAGTLRIGGVGVIAPGLVATMLLALVIAAVVIDRRRGAAVLVFAIFSAVFATIVWTLQWSTLAPAGALAIRDAQRYAVVPAALLGIAVLFALDALLIRVRSPSARIAAGTLVVAIVAVPALIDLRWQDARADGASWNAGLRDARIQCAGPGSPDELAVAIAPKWFPGVVIPCSALEDD